MDDRKIKIRDLETKNLSTVKARNELLEGLGEALFQRIGQREPFDSDAAGTPGGVLVEYRKLQKEIDDSLDIIKSLEKEVLRLKELETEISAREEEKSRLEKELEELYTGIGKALFDDPDYHGITEVLKQQEENLLARIDDQEIKLGDLEKREGGVFAWLGKNAQMTVSKTILLKNRSTLQRLYRDIGDKYISEKPAEPVIGNNAEAVEKVLEVKALLSSLSSDLSGLKGERREIGSQFGGAEGTPSRRIQGHEKHIAHVKDKFPALYLSMGTLASDGEGLLSSFLANDDEPVLEKAGLFKSQITQSELEMEKIKTAIIIDDEKAGIEKIKKAIAGQQQKIADAEKAIEEFEKQITEAEHHIEGLQAFIDNNAGA